MLHRLLAHRPEHEAGEPAVPARSYDQQIRILGGTHEDLGGVGLLDMRRRLWEPRQREGPGVAGPFSLPPGEARQAGCAVAAVFFRGSDASA